VTSGTQSKRYSLFVLNGLGRPAFVSLVGPIFEHSPWIAEQAWLKRPFSNLEALHRALCEMVQDSNREMQLSLIRAHPDLVGRAAMAGTLTPASIHEQSFAGLDKLTTEEIGLFQKYNNEYRKKFGFPFIVCARLNKKEAILGGFVLRLNNSREAEIQTALEEIFKIAWLRLSDVISD
jgi:2-oxo-4-hydroxy-4-carboxy-5-ureidoimidazoline decarboxylase